MKFYEDCIELSDEHLCWKLHNPSLNAEESTILHLELVDACEDEFEKIYGIPFYMLGRSGRHICVEDTPYNRQSYCRMRSTIERLQKSFIETFNNKKK